MKFFRIASSVSARVAPWAQRVEAQPPALKIGGVREQDGEGEEAAIAVSLEPVLRAGLRFVLDQEDVTHAQLRKLEAMLIVADHERTLILTGNGDVLEPDHGAVAIGSGGNYALAAARALLDHTDKTPREVATQAMQIAADVCIYTNGNIIFEELGAEA